MAKFAAGQRTTAANTTWPLISLFSEAVTNLYVLECGIANTSGTAVEVRLARIASGPGTVGGGLVETCLDNPGVTASKGMAFGSHTAGTPTLTDLGYRAVIGPTSGYIFTFDPIEIASAAATVNGIVAIVENGTGQITQSYWKWSE